jgi:hypothetical protein
LLGLLFSPHDGGGIFLRNIGRLAPDYKVLYSRRWNSSIIIAFFKLHIKIA